MAAVDYKERGSRPNCSLWSASAVLFFFSLFKYILKGFMKTAARVSGQRPRAAGLKDWNDIFTLIDMEVIFVIGVARRSR